MKIDKEQLKNALAIVKPALANSDIIEQATSFAFFDDMVVAFNNEISITHPIKDIGIKGAIAAEELYAFLSKITSKEIDLENIKNTIVLKSGRLKATFAIEHKILLPVKEEITKKGKWKSLNDDFLEAIKTTANVASTSNDDPKITCVHINKKGFIESTDNFRVMFYKIKNTPIDKTVLLPAESIKHILQISPSKISFSKGWLHFKNSEETVISCRTFKDTFPDTSKIKALVKNESTTIVFPDEIVDSLDRARIFTEAKQKIDESVTIIIDKKECSISSESATGQFKEILPIKYKGKKLEFTVTPYILMEILKNTKTCYYSSPNLIFKDANWFYSSATRNSK